MLNVLLKRKVITFKNRILAIKGWKIIKNLMFLSVGFGMLGALYIGFYRLLSYLEGIQLIGGMLSWKLTSMLFLITFSMIIVSSIIISMTTLYYSFDLKFLFSCPLNMKVLFLDKAFETVFYSSWTLMLAILPFIIALGQVKSLNFGFYASYIFLVIPFVMIASSFGIIFSMALMYLFPSSRTRDIVWILGSLSLSFVYVVFRFSKPEKLIRPDALEVVAQYINYLQAPTAEYFPSWWLTKAVMSYSHSDWTAFIQYSLYLIVLSIIVYAAMTYLSGFFYMKGFSGAQEGVKFKGNDKLSFEQKMFNLEIPFKDILLLCWKDRKLFLRDARYWSQIILIGALIMVYLFSIKNLPLDGPDIKSLISFLNIGVAGFVVSAIGLRFIFPAISLEGNNWWIIKSFPISIKSIMISKLLIAGIPSVLIGIVLIAFSNKFLEADFFISAISVFTIIITSIAISIMGIGLGALFPDFKVENIHQIESSPGGFIYMACSIGYLALIVGIESWPVQMHFAHNFGRANAWNFTGVGFCAAAFIILNALVMIIPWKLGLKNLEKHEI
ncbi:MAG: hypothetical protein L6420_11930 [Elusimicrobia bacterium]|nr:hypothetical protein [Elusimicrobiota bacterium]